MLVAGVCVAAVLLARVVPPLPGLLVAYGRYAATWFGINEIIYVGEGVTAAVAVSRTPAGVLNYHNAGKVQASSEPQDMKLQRMLGHITTLVPQNPAKVLVIGCGAGVTAGAVSIDPRVTDQTIAEIEPLVPRVVSTYFSEHNFDVVDNPKVRIHLDDARHYLLTTRRNVRRRDLGSARSLGQGCRHAVYPRVLRGDQGAPQSRRRGDAVRPDVREHRRRGQE